MGSASVGVKAHRAAIKDLIGIVLRLIYGHIIIFGVYYVLN